MKSNSVTRSIILRSVNGAAAVYTVPAPGRIVGIYATYGCFTDGTGDLGQFITGWVALNQAEPASFLSLAAAEGILAAITIPQIGNTGAGYKFTNESIAVQIDQPVRVGDVITADSLTPGSGGSFLTAIIQFSV